MEAQSTLDFNPQNTLDFNYIEGQGFAKRALSVAVAGNHSILFYGEPCEDKQLLLDRVSTIAARNEFGFRETINLKCKSIDTIHPVTDEDYVTLNRELLTKYPEFDMYVEIRPLSKEKKEHHGNGTGSDILQYGVETAKKFRAERGFVGDYKDEEFVLYPGVKEDIEDILSNRYKNPTTMAKAMKIARTIADMLELKEIHFNQVDEACSYACRITEL